RLRARRVSRIRAGGSMSRYELHAADGRPTCPRAERATRARRLVSIVAGLLAPLAALGGQSEPVVTTQQQIILGGKPLRYTAQAGRIDIVNSETSELHGRMFFVAYRLPSHDSRRPVTFMWNGGPGSAS